MRHKIQEWAFSWEKSLSGNVASSTPPVLLLPVKPAFNIAIQVPVRAWIAALIVYLRKFP
jgi:hypothetical protein